MCKYVRLRAGEPLRVDWITFLNLLNDIVDGTLPERNGEHEPYSNAETLELFQAFDTHRKGYIRRGDLTAAIREVMPTISEETLSSICERVDPMRSGHVSARICGGAPRLKRMTL